MDTFSRSSKYIINLITKYQNKAIDKQTVNKNLLLNTIFTYNHLKKQNKKNKKIKENQNKIFQEFFKREQEQEKSDRELMSTIRDRISMKVVQESIKEHRENLVKDLSLKKNIKLFPENTYNSYIPPKNISYSLNLELHKNYKNPKNKIIDTNIKINRLNSDMNDKEKILSIDFIEPLYNIDISNETNDETDEFIKMIDEDDSILFYDEKLEKDEKPSLLNLWGGYLKKNEIKNDFEELKQTRRRKTIYKRNDLFNFIKHEKVIKKEMTNYLNNNTNILYDEMSQKNHFHEFNGYLTEKTYKMYMNKMNYSYLILMLLSFFDFEKFSNKYEFCEPSKTLVIFMKKLLLFSGISNNKIYESLINKAKNKKDKITFENYLNFFLPIFELSEKFQSYKYRFLLYLVKKSGDNTISRNNFRLFCSLVKGKLIYESDTCYDIIGKMLPIIKFKYPNDDLDNLNYQHVSIILEFLINNEYGDLL